MIRVVTDVTAVLCKLRRLPRSLPVMQGEVMNRRFALNAAVVVLACFAVMQIGRARNAQSADEGATGPALTIYNQNFAVIRQPLHLDLEPGVNEMQFTETTSFLEPDSVMLRDPLGRHQLQVLEQSFRNDPPWQERLPSC